MDSQEAASTDPALVELSFLPCPLNVIVVLFTTLCNLCFNRFASSHTKPLPLTNEALVGVGAGVASEVVVGAVGAGVLLLVLVGAAVEDEYGGGGVIWPDAVVAEVGC